MSADLDELWFRGDLLGIFFFSVMSSFSFFFFVGFSALVVCCWVFVPLALLFGLAPLFGFVARGVLEGRRYCG